MAPVAEDFEEHPSEEEIVVEEVAVLPDVEFVEDPLEHIDETEEEEDFLNFSDDEEEDVPFVTWNLPTPGTFRQGPWNSSDDTFYFPVWPTVSELLAIDLDGPELNWDVPAGTVLSWI